MITMVPSVQRISEWMPAAPARVRELFDGSTRWPEERNDCVVVALSVAAQIPYDQSHTLCARVGRRPRDGMRTHDALRELCASGRYRMKLVPALMRKRRETFLRDHQQILAPFRDDPNLLGFVGRIRGHAFSVSLDGHVCSFGERRRGTIVTHFWAIYRCPQYVATPQDIYGNE